MNTAEREHGGIRQVLDLFAQHYQLTIALVTAKAIHMCAFAQPDGWHEWIEEEMESLLPTLDNLEEASVLDTAHGFKVLVIPYGAGGDSTEYIMAGMLVERNSRHMIAEFLQENCQFSDRWERALNEAVEVSAEDKKQLIAKLKLLTPALAALREQERGNESRDGYIHHMIQLLSMADQDCSVAQLAEAFLQVAREIDFVGYAERAGEEYRVLHFYGGPGIDSMEGATFMSGEGFLGRIAATGMKASWSQIKHDPRAGLFHSHGVKLQALVGYPVSQRQGHAGVWFAGACQTPEVGARSQALLEIFLKITENSLLRRQLQENVQKQLHRVTAWNEICQLITNIQDVDKLSHILVDMSLNIVEGRFVAMALFPLPGEQEEFRIVSRGLTKEQSEQYGKLLLSRYQENQERDILFATKPAVRGLPWGGYAVECVLRHDREFGVLTAAIDPSDEDAISFLASLATIGAIAIRQITLKQSDDLDQRIHCLHEALAQWAPSDYEAVNRHRELVLLFGEYLELPSSERACIADAALLTSYHPDRLHAALQGDGEKLRQLVQEVWRFREGGTKEAPTPGGQILLLAAAHIANEGAPIPAYAGFQEELVEKFRTFVLQRQILDRRIPTRNRTSEDKQLLSIREQEVLELIVEGHNNREIASRLFISEHTIKNHITKIFHKLGVPDRAGAIAYFYKNMTKQ